MNYKPYIDTTLADDNSNKTIKPYNEPFAQNNVRNIVTYNYIHVVLGILITVVIATTMSFTGMIDVLYATVGRLGVFDLIAAQIVLSIWFNTNIDKIQYSTPKMMFYFYFMLLGITLSAISCAFSIGIIIIAIIIAAVLSFVVK